jgi:hypothetical protein
MKVPDEIIISKIHLVRNCKVMIDRDLAELYGVTTGNLNKAVKRNSNRFPEDFMFQLRADEATNLIFQNGMSNEEGKKVRWGGTRHLPHVFTEQGVAMLSSVLSSEIAVEMNIKIIRIFTQLREMMLTHKDLLLKVEQLENKVVSNSREIQVIFEALKELLQPPAVERKTIGYKINNEPI